MGYNNGYLRVGLRHMHNRLFTFFNGLKTQREKQRIAYIIERPVNINYNLSVTSGNFLGIGIH
jgi:hypothetical protein